MVVYPLAVLAAMLIYLAVAIRFFPYWARFTPWALLTFWAVELVLLLLLIWMLYFFRDPKRHCPSENTVLLSPADGQVTDIETVEDPPAFLRASASYDASRGSGRKQEGGCGAALRIGVFLSIFDTHINRAPCNVKVEKITYRKGKYKNARNPQSGRVNESNELHLVRTDSPQDRLIVRQISGAIARRIVCDKVQGMELTGGQKFGMIKFGSRTELYVPLREAATPGSERHPPAAGVKCLVQIGDKVKAGLTPLVRYEIVE
jgi:phosphatidylserine decarboxylase